MSIDTSKKAVPAPKDTEPLPAVVKRSDKVDEIDGMIAALGKKGFSLRNGGAKAGSDIEKGKK